VTRVRSGHELVNKRAGEWMCGPKRGCMCNNRRQRFVPAAGMSAGQVSGSVDGSVVFGALVAAKRVGQVLCTGARRLSHAYKPRSLQLPFQNECSTRGAQSKAIKIGVCHCASEQNVNHLVHESKCQSRRGLSKLRLLRLRLRPKIPARMLHWVSRHPVLQTLRPHRSHSASRPGKRF